jgi:hypothetical protein
MRIPKVPLLLAALTLPASIGADVNEPYARLSVLSRYPAPAAEHIIDVTYKDLPDTTFAITSDPGNYRRLGIGYRVDGMLVDGIPIEVADPDINLQRATRYLKILNNPESDGRRRFHRFETKVHNDVVSQETITTMSFGTPEELGKAVNEQTQNQ